MLRRNFVRWAWGGLLPLIRPRWVRAQAAGLGTGDAPMLREVASAVLPASFGAARATEIAERFAKWTRNYKPGADAGYGYGFPHLEVLSANPATHYPDQLKQLETAAAAKGPSFAKLDPAAKRDLVAAALEQAQIDRIPSRPNGKHVAADLLAFFYNSADGQDFLYDAAIKRDDCRGLSSSGRRPAPLS
jgi:hypothetical protein